jgi:hypothetical protein
MNRGCFREFAPPRRTAAGGVFFVVNNRGLTDSLKDLLGVPVSHKNETRATWAWIRAHGGDWINGHRAEAFPILATILVLLILPSRLLLLLLAQDILLVNRLAPWFYLTAFGQRKLFKQYRASITTNREVRDDATHYVDLPYECSDKTDGRRLSVTVLHMLAERRGVGIIGEGGRGKTALCRYVATKIIRDAGPDLRRTQPVMIDGLTYTGNLMDAIVDTLKQSRAYVNKAIVESQLSVGYLAILFDGLSEVRESYRDAAEMTDIPAFIRQHPDTPILFTSRSLLPAGIMRALKDVTTIQLKDVDSGTEKEFLAQYLRLGRTEADAVIRQMNERLGDMPRIPLMLKLVATVYDETGNVPKDRPTLLAQYADQLLRSEMTGMKDPSGLRFVLAIWFVRLTCGAVATGDSLSTTGFSCLEQPAKIWRTMISSCLRSKS